MKRYSASAVTLGLTAFVLPVAAASGDIEIISHSVRLEAQVQGGGGATPFVQGPVVLILSDPLVNSQSLDLDTGVQPAQDGAGNPRGSGRGTSDVAGECVIDPVLASFDGSASGFATFEATPDLGVARGFGMSEVCVRFFVTSDTDYTLNAFVSDLNGPLTGTDSFSIRRTSDPGNPPVHLVNSATPSELVGVTGTFEAGKEYTLEVSLNMLTSGGSAQSPGEDAVACFFDLVFEPGTAITVRPPCPADVNGDGIVSPADFNAWIAAFNDLAVECDQNGDGLCNPADFNAWIVNFNTGC